MADDKIIIEFDGDITQLKAKLKETESQTKKLGSIASDAGKAFSAASKVAAVGFGALLATIGKSVSVYREQEQVQLKTVATIEATGKAAGLSSKQVFDMAASLQKVTTYGDEAIIGGQNLLLTFKNIGGEVFPRATETMLDMSAALGQDLKSSAIQLGKALNDPIEGVSALSRVGVQFTGSQKEMIKSLVEANDVAGAQNVILAELEGQLGGTARAAAEGTGSIDQTTNLLGDLAEQIGKASLPAVLLLNTKVKELAELFQNSPQYIETFQTALIGLTQAGALVKAVFSALGAQLGNVLATISEVAATLLEGQFKQALSVAQQGVENTFDIIKESKQQFYKDLDEIDNAFAEKEDKKEDEKLIKIKQNIAAQAEAEKLAQENALQEKLDLLNSQSEILTQEELLLKQSAQEQIALQDEAAKAKELAAAGKHNEALKKLDDLKLKEDIKRGEQRIKLEQQWSQAQVNILSSTANLAAAIGKEGSKEVFLIQKAAALAQAIVATNLAAAQALAVPPAPNVGLAAAAKIAGGINVAAIAASAIKGFAKGGLVEGGVIGKDSVPAFLQRGEIVIPPKTSFQDIVDAGRTVGTDGGNGGLTEVVISFRDNIGEFIEAQILERRTLGIGAV